MVEIHMKEPATCLMLIGTGRANAADKNKGIVSVVKRSWECVMGKENYKQNGFQ